MCEKEKLIYIFYAVKNLPKTKTKHHSIFFLSIFLFVLFLLNGCAHVHHFVYGRTFEPSSFSSYQYLSQILINSQQKTFASQGTLLWVYTKDLGPLLSSQCKNAPSDSQYLSLVSQKQNCPYALALIAAIGRMLREHDLYVVSPQTPFNYSNHLVWPDFSSPCY